MNLFEVLLIVAVVLVMLAGVFNMMGKKTAAKWLLRSLFKTPIGPLCGGIKYFGVKRFS